MSLSLASVCYNALRITGVTSVARRVTSSGLVLCYHNVVGANQLAATSQLGLHMPLATFARQMEWLREHYTVVSLDEFVRRLVRGRSLRGIAAITFDDGYAGVFEHAWPLLRHLGLAATVFIVADAPERQDGFWWDDPDVLRVYSPERERRWLTDLQGDQTRIVGTVAPGRVEWPSQRGCRPATWEVIAAAAASGNGEGGGIHIGVHSATHRSLPTLTEVDLSRELLTSRTVIERHTGVTPTLFSYPYGHWNDRVRRAVVAAGYRGAFTLAADRLSRTRDPWTIPRLNIPASIDDAAFEAWTAGLNLRRRLSA